ncbi:YecA family protein [Rouxiella sp. WC2420]|uniref:YecA family protein n=1 Tax=Rouxiella sp. WC2420 TaxID=3234145 RepID=A0AB39VUE6_9GAMM
MKEGPLNEKELEWLEEILEKYGNERSVIDVAELDGLLTAILSGPVMIEPSEWLVALWGGQEHIPKWSNERELKRFMDLTFQHMNDISDRLTEYPDQFEPLFGVQDIDDEEYTVAEEWCYGYMRGWSLSDWSTLPQELEPALKAIALHGSEENVPVLEQMSNDEIEASIEKIKPAALALHDYWLAKQPEAAATPSSMPIVVAPKTGRNDPCPCGSGKKYKNCCLH